MHKVRQCFAVIALFFFATTAAAQTNYTALWWNPNESGWGINLNHQDNTLFATLFTYDAAGEPMWLVMSNGALQANGTTFSGDVYKTTGSRYYANPFPPITSANITKVGTMLVAFTSATAGTLSYTVDGVPVTKAIQPQVFGATRPTCSSTTSARSSLTNYQDLWWNASESGWGLNIAHQGDTIFATLFTYSENGRALWLVMSAGQRQVDGSYSGTLYRTTGPAFSAQPFTPISASNLTAVGSMQLRFSDGVNGTLSYSVNGVSVTKAITRQVFGVSTPACISPQPPAAQICSTGDFFNSGQCLPVGAPYTITGSTQATVIGSSETTLGHFSIRAINGPLTVSLSAADLNRVVTPSFGGISSGQVIAEGQTIGFSLVSPLTRGRQANLRYTIHAGGRMVFDATYVFLSN